MEQENEKADGHNGTEAIQDFIPSDGGVTIDFHVYCGTGDRQVCGEHVCGGTEGEALCGH